MSGIFVEIGEIAEVAEVAEAAVAGAEVAGAAEVGLAEGGLARELRSLTRSLGLRRGKVTFEWILVYDIIPQVIAEVEAKARATVRRVAEEMATDAKANAPVLTGYLRDSIKAASKGKSGGLVAEAPYAGYVEYGTYKMAAQPFMTPAVEAHKSDFFAASSYFPLKSL